MKRVLVSVGPIPAKLDSVKYLTNRFNGGLALLAAKRLDYYSDLRVSVVAWNGTNIGGFSGKVYRVDDVEEYYQFVKRFEADAYVLCAAVANLMPKDPYLGKFPSHNYTEGDEFDIRFKIAPRIIDRVLEWHPKTTLIGYKLFDGPPDAVAAAGRLLMDGSNARLVFCNTPADAKVEKVVLTQEKGAFPIMFDDHINLMANVIRASWYKTIGQYCSGDSEGYRVSPTALEVLNKVVDDHGHGTFAVINGHRMITTTRRKGRKTLIENICSVTGVDHNEGTVTAKKKATMNAPVLWEILHKRLWKGIVVHGHVDTGGRRVGYLPPGTKEEVTVVAKAMRDSDEVVVEGHGYYKWFRQESEALEFVNHVRGVR